MDPELKSRWNRMFNQAEGFEAVDKIEEARARCRLARQEIAAALASASDPAARKALERFHGRAQRFVERYDALYAEWERRAQERMEKYVKREEDEYHGPLAAPPLPSRT